MNIYLVSEICEWEHEFEIPLKVFANREAAQAFIKEYKEERYRDTIPKKKMEDLLCELTTEDYGENYELSDEEAIHKRHPEYSIKVLKKTLDKMYDHWKGLRIQEIEYVETKFENIYMNLFETYLEEVDSDIYNVLSTFAPYFENAGIETVSNTDLLYCDNADELCTNLKLILLETALEEGILPSWCEPIDEWFEIDGDFYIKRHEDYNCKAIQKSFDDWCGIELNIY